MVRVVCCLLLFGVACGLAQNSEIRVWTAANGKSLEARLVLADPSGRVIIQRADGNEFELKAGQLSAEDQVYIKKYLADQGTLPNPARGLGKSALKRVYVGRCMPLNRKALIRDAGMDGEKYEAAITQGLDYLQSMQNPSGSFGSDYPVSVTSLALLAFVGNCEGPNSQKYGKTVVKAAVYLINRLGDYGIVSPTSGASPTLENALATYALAELLVLTRSTEKGVTQIPDLSRVVSRGLGFVTKRQVDDSYRPSIWIVFWQLQALFAAKDAGFDLTVERPIENALQYLKDSQNVNGGIPMNPENGGLSSLLSGIAPYALRRAGKGNDPSIAPAMTFLEDIGGGRPKLVVWYIDSHTHALGGAKEMKDYATEAFPQLLGWQKDDGSFDKIIPGEYWATELSAQDEYITAMVVLILQSPYRYVASG